ncbi:hypothetical protein OG21DRAFT_1526029 [Imleria badia]|nr:hypothetical protein OG21DRAFT_1526029 [Imleria badia]
MLWVWVFTQVCPDYVLPEFEDARLIFTVDGKTKEEAAVVLRNLWNINYTRDIENWECQWAVDTETERQPLPNIAPILPPQHALNKLHKGDYVPLYLFTNKGIRKVEEDGLGDEDLLTLTQTDKGPTFQTSASVKAQKHKVKDEALLWEESGQANYRMLNTMRQQEWPADRLEMISGATTLVNTTNVPY